MYADSNVVGTVDRCTCMANITGSGTNPIPNPNPNPNKFVWNIL